MGSRALKKQNVAKRPRGGQVTIVGETESFKVAAVKGAADGKEWAREQDIAALDQELSPGHEDADEALINAMGFAEIEESFGAKAGTELFQRACRAYSAAHRRAVALERKARGDSEVADG